MRKARTRIAYIRWFDSSIYTGESCPADEIMGILENESAGVLVCENKTSITIALDHCLETDNVRLVLCIPKANVRRIKKFVISDGR